MKKHINLPSEILDSWKHQTDINNHSEVRVEIAVYFGYDDYAEQFLAILDRHNENGYLTGTDMINRYNLTNSMLTSIKREYGKKTYEQVYNCL